ncbi:DUF72 domain-containing protein [Curtobacterium sp. MCJR17_043]|uniref:DUF72 domain-containing protein n=1 Tax=Curtobacterium sp. MCJR17_043 TaxID=2175660 RepID=UPI0024DFFD3C|nr:DUF72 domain-containing protein [Curtobacterium sp. MCJR17_043]WIB37052.1 DUF72 domain-containing protein [Curtobacterium sp. MCJR17_043]
MHGAPHTYHDGYPPEALADWANTVRRHDEAGRDVWVFFDNDAERHAPLGRTRPRPARRPPSDPERLPPAPARRPRPRVRRPDGSGRCARRARCPRAWPRGSGRRVAVPPLPGGP